MRKYILIFISIILALILFLLMFFGFKLGGFKINSYKEVQEIGMKKNALQIQLEQKNNTEYEEKKEALEKVINEYNETKVKYDELVSQGKITNQDIYNSIDLYDVDFLWATIGNYATSKGVTLQLDVARSATATSISSEYIMCDLKFTITGEYIAITDFIYSLEGDDKLKFEISEFLLEKGGENLQATFSVKEVPINSNNLSSVPTATSTVTTDSTTEN